MDDLNILPNRRRAWTITLLLFVFLIINFADKAVLGLAAAPMMHELSLSASQYGLVATAFFFLFGVAALVVGFISDKVPTKWIIMGLAVAWSISQLPMLLPIAGFWTLLLTRVVLGAAEGPAAPIANHAAHKWFTDRDRGLVSCLIGIGVPIGVVIAAPSLSWVIANYGWRDAFGVMGVIGIVWALIWGFVGKEGPVQDEVSHDTSVDNVSSVPIWRILTTGSWLASVAGGFAAYWSLAILIAWLPSYLTNGLGFDTATTGTIVILPWAIMGVGLLVLGFVTRRLLVKGTSSRIARGIVTGVCIIVSGLSLLGAMAIEGSGAIKLALLAIGLGFGSVVIPVAQAICAEIAPSNRRGAVLGTYCAVYSLAGVIAPALTGALIDSTATPEAGYKLAFTVAAVLLVVGGLIFIVFVRPERDRALLSKFSTGSPSAVDPLRATVKGPQSESVGVASSGSAQEES